MATPTPGKHGGPPVVATPPVSTPRSVSGTQSHLAAANSGSAFSPNTHGNVPRSVVPSPSQIKKSPANFNTLYGHASSSSFGAVNFDSPSTAAALGVLPALGDLTLDAAGGLMLTGTAGGSGVGSRGDEDELRKRLGQVVDLLKWNRGRVSEEGVERLATRVGLECLWEDQMGSGGTIRTLVIAGTGLSLEVDFANNAVSKVSLSYPESPEIVTKHSSDAAQIMLQDLQLGPGESPLTKMLDRFAMNLERLAALDKLSVMPILNCHEAIAGIFESLQRLHEWEVLRLTDEGDMSQRPAEYVTRTAICTKSGRPLMNARQNVGLSLDYWQERHIRTRESNGRVVKFGTDEPKTWSLIVECAPSSSLVYASVRVTDKWISSDIQKANPTADDLIMETGGAVLDWQEPENILLPSSDSSKVDGAMEGIEQDLAASNSKSPDVMFVAKFHPPLVVPFAVANQIYSSTGAILDSFHLPTLDGLLFPPKAEERSEPDATYRRLQRQRSVVVVEGNQNVKKTHKMILTFQKLEYGRTMSELPFSHPRQLVELLPIFRQYACTSSLLDRSFGSHTEEVSSEDEDQAEPWRTVREEYDAFMSEALGEQTGYPRFDKLPVDVTVYTTPHPTLRVTFPFRKRTADICFEIGMNGVMTVAFENVLGDDTEEGSHGKRRELEKADLGRMLEISEDIGLFAEFVRHRLQ